MNRRRTDELASFLQRMLPSPFSIAIGLSIVAMLLAFIFSRSEAGQEPLSVPDLLLIWGEGMWNSNLMVFAFQMMLMLVLGHVLALSKPIDQLIQVLIRNFCSSGPKATFILTLFTLLMAFVNWGLGLVFGAIFARALGEFASKNKIPMNYPLLAAGGYSGLMVWHGGLSGSSLVKVAEPGHLKTLMAQSSLHTFPERISLGATVFSNMNICASIALLILLPLSLYLVAKRWKGAAPQVQMRESTEEEEAVEGMEKLDLWKGLGVGFGLVILVVSLLSVFRSENMIGLSFITPNWINQSFLALGLIFHGSIRSFLKALDKAIGGSAGILIQFPLYFGVMALIQNAGMIPWLAEIMSSSGSVFFPILTMFSAGLVNIFVPSGGGQWAVQGALVMESAASIGIPFHKAILALAYGDQLTNMLQPFWALPLLGITGLKAKAILPYTLLLMALGIIVFTTVLLVF